MSVKCYAKLSNNVTAATWVPCGPTNSSTPYVPCCAAGDFCLTSGLCRYTHLFTGGSGYYAAGCTDSTFKNGQCPQLCNDQRKRDVVYNTTAKNWHCCGADANNNVNCDAPTTESFTAPVASSLKTYYTAGATTSSKTTSPTTKPTTTKTASSATDTTATATGTSGAKHSSQLSSGAAGGIGAAIAVVGIALLAVIGFFVWRRRRAGWTQKTAEGEAIPYQESKDGSVGGAKYAKYAPPDGPQELAGDAAYPVEAGSTAVAATPLLQEHRSPVELPADEATERGRPAATATPPRTPAMSPPETSAAATASPARSNTAAPVHPEQPTHLAQNLPETLRVRTPEAR